MDTVLDRKQCVAETPPPSVEIGQDEIPTCPHHPKCIWRGPLREDDEPIRPKFDALWIEKDTMLAQMDGHAFLCPDLACDEDPAIHELAMHLNSEHIDASVKIDVDFSRLTYKCRGCGKEVSQYPQARVSLVRAKCPVMTITHVLCRNTILLR
jgi:hypothetical protein